MIRQAQILSFYCMDRAHHAMVQTAAAWYNRFAYVTPLAPPFCITENRGEREGEHRVAFHSQGREYVWTGSAIKLEILSSTSIAILHNLSGCWLRLVRANLVKTWTIINPCEIQVWASGATEVNQAKRSLQVRRHSGRLLTLLTPTASHGHTGKHDYTDTQVHTHKHLLFHWISNTYVIF